MAERKPVELPDVDHRRIAATEFETNLVVLAGAGTGKTSLLIERMLSAIGADVVRINRLAAMTFTEKAAGEMRERMALGLERLRSLASGRSEDEEGETEAGRAFIHLTTERGIPATTVERRALEALEELDLATVTTIHGFCSTLLRAHPVPAGVDPDFVVDAGEQAAIARRELWEGFIARELGPSAARAGLWEDLLRRLPIDDVEQAAFALADFGVPDRLLQPPFPAPSAQELFGDEAAKLVREVDSLLSRQSGMSKVGVAYFSSVRNHLTRFADEGLLAFQDAIRADADFHQRIRKNNRPHKYAKLAGATNEELESLSANSRAMAVKLLEIDEETTRLLVEVLAPYVIDFRDSFLRQGFATFDGLLVLARNLLRDHPGIRRQLKSRFRLLLVDEFQDTDPLQYEIVLFLAQALDEEGRDPFSSRLEPGRLFIVGDAKQSIYRFRGADYSAYTRAVEKVLETGGRELVLSANFRSLAGIVEPVNRLFGGEPGSCWIRSEYQPEYQRIEAMRRTRDDAPRTEIWTLAHEAEPTAGERREAEGELIAEEIERLVDEEGVDYKEITLLFRALTSLAYYVRPLRRRDIPFVVDGGREFLDRPEVAHLMAALRTLAQPADQTALLAFLRSPSGAIPDTDLASFGTSGGQWDWRHEIDGERYPGIAERFEFLRRLAEETHELPADAVVRRVLERTLLLPLNATAFEGPQRVANLRKLAASAGELARDGRLSLEEVVEALQEGRLAEVESDAPLADDSVDAVRITSIHRMKGLESSWIFLPDVARQRGSGHSGRALARAVRGDRGEMLALRVKGACNPASLWWERENDLHEEAEEVRVLYVALTRAKNRLVVVVGSPREKAPWIKALEPWGYDATDPPPDGATLCDGGVQHRVMKTRGRPRRRGQRMEADTTREQQRYVEAVCRLREAAGSALLAAPSGLGEESGRFEEESAVPAATARTRNLGRAAGIVVHRLLELWRGEQRETTLASLAQLSRATADAERMDREELERETRSIVEAFLDSRLATRLSGAEVLGRELPMLLRRETGQVLRGSIDLLYRDAKGDIVVADYKTDRETGEDRLRDLYGEQLAAYAESVRRALELGKPPRTEIWSVRTGSIVVLSDG
jgi:ATP-dependent helicase/nuclease subunit A